MEIARIALIPRTCERRAVKELRLFPSRYNGWPLRCSIGTRKRFIVLLLITMSLVILARLTSGDTVYLKSGKKIEGAVTETKDGVSIRTNAGFTIPVPRANIEKIVKEGAASQAKPAAGGKKGAAAVYRHVAPLGSVTVTASTAPIQLARQVIHRAKKGDSFVVEKVQGDYYLVSVFVGGQTKKAWISAKQVSWLPAGRVRATAANVPISLGGKVIARARKGVWHQVVMKKRGYYFVEIPATKKRGWISEKQCEWGSDMELEVTAEKAVVRQGSKVVATAKKGQHLDVYAKVYAKNKGFFYLVKSVGRRGKTGWLRAEQAGLPRLKPGKASG